MIKKILVLLAVLIFITGCDITYNLDVTEDTFKESIIFNADVTSIYSKEYLYEQYRQEYPIYIDQEFLYYDPFSQVEDYDYYTKNFTELDNGYLFNYQASYDYDDFNRARSINTFYDTIGIGYVSAEDYYYLSMRDILIFNYDNNINLVTINIDFNDLEVISSNADNYSNNVYTWYITRDNPKSLNVSYKTKAEDPEISQPEMPSKEEVNQNNELTSEVSEWVNSNKTIVYVGVFVILLCIIIIFSVLKSKKR